MLLSGDFTNILRNTSMAAISLSHKDVTHIDVKASISSVQIHFNWQCQLQNSKWNAQLKFVLVRRNPDMLLNGPASLNASLQDQLFLHD